MAADGDVNGEQQPMWTVSLDAQGWSFFASAAESILCSAENAGLELPSSCRNGTCRTCICRMRSGTVRYLIEWPGLSVDEKEEGWILPCIARPCSDIMLEVPLALMV